MTTDWLLRVGDGKNMIASSKYNIWGIQTTTSPHGKNFIKNVKRGDRLWFVTSKTQGKMIAVATYSSHIMRDLGPLINLSRTDDDFGWTRDSVTCWTCDTEVHYEELYNVSACDGLLTHIMGPTTIRRYDKKCRVDLATEYGNIVKYSMVTKEM